MKMEDLVDKALNEADSDSAFKVVCPNCGASMNSPKGSNVPTDGTKCVECGAKMKKESVKFERDRDGTGPAGKGPRTGRGLGDCPDDDDEDDEADEKKKKGKKETVDIAIDRLLNIQEADVTKIIGDLVDTDLGGSNKDQGKFVSLLKGLAFSDDPKANEFMKGMDKAATTVGKKVLG